jgi:hypothetical protein
MKLTMYVKKILSTLLLAISVGSFSRIYTDPNDYNLGHKMGTNYWFGGYTWISSSNPTLQYKMYTWNNTAGKFTALNGTLPINSVVNIRDRLGSSNNIGVCPYMYWYTPTSQFPNGNGAIIILVPQVSYFPNSEQTPEQFYASLNAGQIAPYIFIQRDDAYIHFYIVGPTIVYPYKMEKLSFNLGAFQTNLVRNSYWFNHIISDDNPAYGMVFACSFNADLGSFYDFQNNKLNDNAFYIYGIQNYDSGLGCNCNGTYDAQKNQCINPTTLCTSQQQLIDQGILTYQKMADLCDTQWVIDYINWTGLGQITTPGINKNNCQ